MSENTQPESVAKVEEIAQQIAEAGFHRDCGNHSPRVIESELEDIESILRPYIPSQPPVSGNGPEPRVSLASVTDYDTLFKCPACSSCLRLIGNRVLVDDCNGAQPTPKVEEK